MAAKKLTLVLPFTHQQEQMAVGGLHVQDGDLDLGSRLVDDLEELTLAVGLHVEGDDTQHAGTTGRAISDLEPSADAGKLDVEEVRVHKREDTAGEGVVRQVRAVMVISLIQTECDDSLPE
jgi:hypothetical protein